MSTFIVNTVHAGGLKQIWVLFEVFIVCDFKSNFRGCVQLVSQDIV